MRHIPNPILFLAQCLAIILGTTTAAWLVLRLIEDIILNLNWWFLLTIWLLVLAAPIRYLQKRRWQKLRVGNPWRPVRINGRLMWMQRKGRPA